MVGRAALSMLILISLFGGAALAQRELAAEPLVVAVPIHGRVGEDVLAPAVQGALRRAAKLRATDIVFLIDSSGGRVPDARAIQLVLADYDEQFRFHAIVTGAVGVSVGVLAWCDSIHTLPNALVRGIAEPEHAGASAASGSLCAQVCAAAEQHDQPAAIFEAVLLPEKELYSWTDADGAFRLSASRSAAGANPSLLDSASTAPTFTGEQLIQFGLASPLDSTDLAALGSELGISWREVPRIAQAEALRAANDLKRNARERDRALRAVQDARDKIKVIADRIERQRVGAEEAAQNYAIYRRSSRGYDRARVGAIDYAISQWSDVIASLHALDEQESALAAACRLLDSRLASEHKLRLYDRFEEFAPQAHEPAEHGIDKDGLYQEARREQARLREMK